MRSQQMDTTKPCSGWQHCLYRMETDRCCTGERADCKIKNFRYYIFTTIMVLMVMLLEGNQAGIPEISKPIRELDASVKTYEAGGKRIFT